MASGMDVVGGRSTAVCGGKVEPSTNNVETVIDLTADKTEEVSTRLAYH